MIGTASTSSGSKRTTVDAVFSKPWIETAARMKNDVVAVGVGDPDSEAIEQDGKAAGAGETVRVARDVPQRFGAQPQDRDATLFIITIADRRKVGDGDDAADFRFGDVEIRYDSGATKRRHDKAAA